jgi:hypothetical protein
LGDAINATQPVTQEVLNAEMGYLFTAEEDSQRYLFEKIASLERRNWTGRKHQIWRYRGQTGYGFATLMTASTSTGLS